MTEANGRRLIPPEIMEEILCKLPVKSLKRFSCVSKSWQSLISEHRFVRKHLNGAAQPENLTKRTLMIINPMRSANESLYCIPLSSVQNVGGYYLGGPCTGDYRQILASYDGLLCIRIDQSVYIWNPFLKTHSKILALTDFRTCYYGFGYDSRRDDYKLIKLERIRCRDTTETEVYSLRSRSWTKLDNFPNGYKHNLKFTSAFVNGSVHWLAINLFLKPNPFVLFSFDLLDNKYREMILPEFWPVSRYVVDVKLCVLRGMLCVLVYWNFCLVLWAMKDYYSDQKSWTKILDIRFDLVFDEYCTAVDIKPFYMYENGEVLMGVSSKHGTELLICKDNSVLFREIIFGNPYLIHYAFVHVESLISPLRVENREEFIP